MKALTEKIYDQGKFV